MILPKFKDRVFREPAKAVQLLSEVEPARSGLPAHSLPTTGRRLGERIN